MKSPVIALLASIFAFVLQPPSPQQSSIQSKQAIPAQQNELQQRPDTDDDWQIQNWLNDGPGAIERLVGLGVDSETAKGFVDSFEENDLHIQWHSVRSDSTALSAMLFLPCNGMGGANLFALKKGTEGWRTTDRVGFDCHYDDTVSMEIAQIHDPNRDEVLIHHACQEHGTGFVQQNYNVFSVAQGKLKLRLDTVEVLDDHQPPERIHDIVRRSTFVVIPILNSRSRAIEETRSSTLNDHLTVQRRIFRWEPKKARYESSGFTPVAAVPAS
jgi:hypothetical protein